MTWEAIKKQFSFINDLPEEIQIDLKKYGQMMKVDSGKILFSSSDPCDFIPLVIQGVLRVFQVGENGREVTLYRAYSGDTCLLNLVCSQEDVFLSAQVVADEDCEIFFIPKRFFYTKIGDTLVWKNFLIETLYKRLSETMMVLEQVAFTRMDKRLAQVLLNLSRQQNGMISITHEQLAIELGTAREVVSRLLGELRRLEIVHLKRGKIEIINAKKLQNML